MGDDWEVWPASQISMPDGRIRKRHQMSGDRMQCEFFVVRICSGCSEKRIRQYRSRAARSWATQIRRWCDLPGIGPVSDALIPKPTLECWKRWKMSSENDSANGANRRLRRS